MSKLANAKLPNYRDDMTLDQVRTMGELMHAAIRYAELTSFVVQHPCPSNRMTMEDAWSELVQRREEMFAAFTKPAKKARRR